MNEVTGKQEVRRNFLYFRMYRIIYPSGGREQVPRKWPSLFLSGQHFAELLFSGRVPSSPLQL